jgi:diaminopimelate decarboxylase
MASNYNARGMPAEILVNGKKAAVVRRRQALEDIWASEKIPKWLR